MSFSPLGQIGKKDDAAATTDTGTFSLIALIKRLLSRSPIAVDADNAVLTNTKPSIGGGKAVDPTSLTEYTSGDAVIAPYDYNNGVPLVEQGDLEAKYDSVSMSENFVISESTLNRPNNMTAYIANDIICNSGGSMIGFNSVSTGTGSGQDGGGYITGLVVSTNETALIGKTLRLVIFNGGFSYGPVDNNPYNEDVDMLKWVIAQIDIPIVACINSSTDGKCVFTDLRIPYKTNGGQQLEAVCSTKDAFTPTANGTKIYFKLTVTRNN